MCQVDAFGLCRSRKRLHRRFFFSLFGEDDYDMHKFLITAHLSDIIRYKMVYIHICFGLIREIGYGDPLKKN